MRTKPENYTSDILNAFLNAETPDSSRIERRMLLAAKIADGLKAKGWRKGQLADALGKRPSEISRYLSGTHNFTTDTLFAIEDALDIDLVNLRDKETTEPVLIYHAVVPSLEIAEFPFAFSQNSCLTLQTHIEISSATSHIYN